MNGEATTLQDGPVWARGVLASYGPVTPTQADRIRELEDELKTLRKLDPIDSDRMRWTNGSLYMIVSAFVTVVIFVVGFDQRARSADADRKAEIAMITVKMEAKEKVEQADQRYRDLKDSTLAAEVIAVKQRTELAHVYITTLQQKVR